MPVDTTALVALSGLASGRSGRSDGDEPAPEQPSAAPPAAGSTARRRIAVLAAASVGAGLVCGLVLPGPAEADPPTGPPRAAVAHGTARLGPVLLTSPSPFAAVRTLARTSVVPSGAVRAVPATTGALGAAAGAVAGAVGAATRAAAAPVSDPAADPLPHRAGAPRDPALAAYVPTRPLPARSGAGRRIVYAERAAHLWVVGADGRVLRDYPVTGRAGRPRPGVYHVYSKSPVAVNPGEGLRFEYMVRFAVGVTGARIGFHTIPRYADGVPIQSESQLGRAIGAGGCVRQSRADATWLYGWSHVGDVVVVLR